MTYQWHVFLASLDPVKLVVRPEAPAAEAAGALLISEGPQVLLA